MTSPTLARRMAGNRKKGRRPRIRQVTGVTTKGGGLELKRPDKSYTCKSNCRALFYLIICHRIIATCGLLHSAAPQEPGYFFLKKEADLVRDCGCDCRCGCCCCCCCCCRGDFRGETLPESGGDCSECCGESCPASSGGKFAALPLRPAQACSSAPPRGGLRPTPLDVPPLVDSGRCMCLSVGLDFELSS